MTGVNYDTTLGFSNTNETGVSVFDTAEKVSYSQKRLTPLFGVTMTPSFLQCTQVQDHPCDAIWALEKLKSLVQ